MILSSLKAALGALAFCFALPAFAAGLCDDSRDLIADLSPETRAALVSDIPFATGNFWQARRGEAQMLLIGTYHLDHFRFDDLVPTLAPAIQGASGLWVELAPKDEAALKSWLGSHPEALFDQKGPSLRDRLGAEDWAALSQALQRRGTYPVTVLKTRPWVVASMLEKPACLGATEEILNGLDRRLSALAAEQGLPIHSLEPFDTAVKVFSNLTPEEQLDMIRQGLLIEPKSDDMAATLVGAYFRGESQLYIAFTRQMAIDDFGLDPAEVDRQMKLMFNTLLDGRNAAWVPVLEKASEAGPLVAAFGALHLGGEKGVLNLLAAEGWQVTPWTPGDAWPAP
ncbi:TraB/GumN family protein [Stagnihabitans tardus]|uniref:TraB/GumN family protein n=1 Tax=Stagnihabitans tardus TaxID=2699202 RepID=A0AAE5BSV7_9RHOB|nr:TraB/GumN family protein [Stagnihabitans tardus]NBZ88325.1 TraB/GumN family protein [Stagnihabitans tardus]